MAEQASFARDLGYLDKFLAALAAHAEGLSEPDRTELLGLLAEENARWPQIKALLEGKAPARPQGGAETKPRAPEPAAQQQTAAPGWTVGSLMP